VVHVDTPLVHCWQKGTWHAKQELEPESNRNPSAHTQLAPLEYKTMLSEQLRQTVFEEQEVQWPMVQGLQEYFPVPDTVRYDALGQTQLVKSESRMRGEAQLRHSSGLGP